MALLQIGATWIQGIQLPVCPEGTLEEEADAKTRCRHHRDDRGSLGADRKPRRGNAARSGCWRHARSGRAQSRDDRPVWRMVGRSWSFLPPPGLLPPPALLSPPALLPPPVPSPRVGVLMPLSR